MKGENLIWKIPNVVGLCSVLHLTCWFMCMFFLYFLTVRRNSLDNASVGKKLISQKANEISLRDRGPTMPKFTHVLQIKPIKQPELETALPSSASIKPNVWSHESIMRPRVYIKRARTAVFLRQKRRHTTRKDSVLLTTPSIAPDEPSGS